MAQPAHPAASPHGWRPRVPGFSWTCLERTAGTRHIVAVVTRLQTAFEDSPLLRSSFHTAASQ